MLLPHFCVTGKRYSPRVTLMHTVSEPKNGTSGYVFASAGYIHG